MQKVRIINDPNLVISLRQIYYPTNFGLSTTPYAWGSASDYTSMQDSIAQQRKQAADPGRHHRRMGLHGGPGDGKQGGARAGLRPRHDDCGPRSSLVGQRGLRHELVRDLRPHQRRSNPIGDRQWDHDRRQKRSGGAQQLGNAL